MRVTRGLAAVGLLRESIMAALAIPTMEELAEAAERAAPASSEIADSDIKLLAFELWRRASSEGQADPWVSDCEALLCRASCF